METVKIRDAEQARIEKEKKAVTTEMILADIGINVVFGNLVHRGYMPNKVLAELINLGFTITKDHGPMKEPVWIIEW